MLRTRVISAIIGILALMVIVWLGGLWWLLFSSALAVLCLREFYLAAHQAEFKPVWSLGFMILGWAFLTYYYPGLQNHLLTALVIISAMVVVISYPRHHIMDLAVTWLGALYIGILSSYIMRLGFLPHHFQVILMALLVTWAADTGGYFAGNWWGKRKMVPELSPNKTWMGFVGGLTLAIAIGATGIWLLPGHALYQYIGLGLAGGIMAPIGDLFASGIKRTFKIKDFGAVIPGHGGFLDRFDSLLIVAPLVYYFVAGIGG